jgi:hypothetical protein
MKKYYKTSHKLFLELIDEKRKSKKSMNRLAFEHLTKAWFCIIENTGGGAVSKKDSKHYEERALFHIEKIISDLNKTSSKVCKHKNTASVAGIITCLDCNKTLCDY